MNSNRTEKFCYTLKVPSAEVYFENISYFSLAFIIIGFIIVIILTVIYVIELKYVYKYISDAKHMYRTGQVAWLLGVYPVTSFLSTIGASVPRSMPITNMFLLLYFSHLLFVFTQLVIDIFGGRKSMTCKVHGTMLKSNVCPGFCCCDCLPKIKPSLINIRRVEAMVYQVALIRPLLFFIYGTVWADAKGDVSADNMFFQMTSIVNFSSTLLAMYGFNLIANMAAAPLKVFHIRAQMKLIQMLMVAVNLQGNILALLAGPNGPIFCDHILPSGTRANFFNFVLIPIECLILSLCTAWFLRPATNALFDLLPKQQRQWMSALDVNESMVKKEDKEFEDKFPDGRGDQNFSHSNSAPDLNDLDNNPNSTINLPVKVSECA